MRRFRAKPKNIDELVSAVSFDTPYDKYFDGEYVYGYLVGNYIVGDVVESTEEYIALEYWVPIIPETVGQYTGLKDRNGVEIYEGDILKEPTSDNRFFYVTVVFEDGAFKGKEISHKPEFPICDFPDAKVVGNIFENADLLEVEDA